MKLIGILLILLGIMGIVMGAMMFGDIGIACIVGALSALLSGFGFLSVNKKIKKWVSSPADGPEINVECSLRSLGE